MNEKASVSPLHSEPPEGAGCRRLQVEKNPGGMRKLSLLERIGYGGGDAAANFVFMTMVLFQTNFYTDVFGISATAAATVLLVARAWDALVDPVVGYFADRTRSRWGKYRPWILATAIPWSVLMVVAYSTPSGLDAEELFAYAVVTNALLMSVYSMNNMPYAALGSVMTSDVDERARLNACRFILVNIAQLVVGGLTLPLVAKFSLGHTRQYGWQCTIVIWAALCAILFLFTFATTQESVQSRPRDAASIGLNLAILRRCRPWIVMCGLTLINYALLSFRGSALYDYYHYYAAKPAMLDVLQRLGLVLPAGAGLTSAWLKFLDMLGYIVRDGGAGARASSVADVFNSIVNILNTVVTILVLLASPALSRTFGRKAVAVAGFSLAGIFTMTFYLLNPANVLEMIALTAVICACYAPTIPLIWAMYADVTDYIEWKTGRRLDGVTFATIGVALKFGLACGSSGFLWIMAGWFGYDARRPYAGNAILGFRVCSTLITGSLLVLCGLVVAFYELNRRATLCMAEELAVSRGEAALSWIGEVEAPGLPLQFGKSPGTQPGRENEEGRHD